MKTLKDYTDEIKAKIPAYQDRARKDLYNGTEYANYVPQDTIDYVTLCYEKVEKQKPIVLIANTIAEYKVMYNNLFNTKLNNGVEEMVDELHTLINSGKDVSKKMDALNKIATKEKGKRTFESAAFSDLFLLSEYSRVYLMWYKFIKDEFELPCTHADFIDTLYELVNKANIAKGYFCEKIALILRMPKEIRRNSVGFHDTSYDGAIIYPDEKFFYINHRSMPNWVFDKYFNKTLTFEDFLNEENEDIKGGIITLIEENEGNAGLLKFLNAELIDEATITHDNGTKEEVKLYKTKEKYSFLQDHLGNTNVPYAFTSMTCPSTGQPYLISTSAAFDNVIDSMKFHRPSGVPMTFDYNWMDFTN